MEMGETLIGVLFMGLFIIAFSGWGLDMALNYGRVPANVTYLEKTSKIRDNAATIRQTFNSSELVSGSDNVLASIPAAYATLELFFDVGDILTTFIGEASALLGLPADVTGIVMAIVLVGVLFIFMKAVLGR